MTLDQLRYFQAVCKYGGVSHAAEILNISQPSVSNAIANLEKEFGVDLFTRQHKRLLLTNAGQLLSELADKLLLQADDLRQSMQEFSKKDRVLRLGVPPMIGSLILPVLYDGYFKLHPNLQVRIVEDDNSGLKRLLDENQIDIAFLPHAQPFGDALRGELLTELQNVCCVSNAHRLASRKSIRLEELTDEPLVLFKNSFFQTERILGEFKRLSCKPNVMLYTAQLSTVQNMITGNTAIGFVFEPLLKSMPELVGIPLDPPMTTRISLVRKNSGHISPEMKDLIQFIKHAPTEIWAI